jgi:hypothetical protein
MSICETNAVAVQLRPLNEGKRLATVATLAMSDRLEAYTAFITSKLARMMLSYALFILVQVRCGHFLFIIITPNQPKGKIE